MSTAVEPLLKFPSNTWIQNTNLAAPRLQEILTYDKTSYWILKRAPGFSPHLHESCTHVSWYTITSASLLLLICLRKHEIIFAFCVISWHWNDTGSWKPSSWKAKTCLSYVINFMVADGLVTQVAWASSTMVLTCCSQNHADSSPEGLTHSGRDKTAAILQMTFSNAFSWMKLIVFLFKFHWNMFPGVQLGICQPWFRW